MHDEKVWRARIISVARSWLGTPYHHQAALKGVGADCLGLVRGVWFDLYGRAAERPPAYTRDWAEAGGVEAMLAGARRHLLPVDVAEAEAGDVLVFRFRANAIAKHAGVLTDQHHFIHAMEGGAASEVVLSAWWRRRIAAAFAFPIAD